jgi:SARP family transcriptional regulator, regulator of embCAB operon
MRFSILGPVEVMEKGDVLTPRAHKIRVLLAVLLVSRNRVVSADRLVGELWGEEPPRTALQALRVYVSQLRQMLAVHSGADPAPRLETCPPGYRLAVAPGAVDSLEFERLSDRGRRNMEQKMYDAAADDMREALALWRGPALMDVRTSQTLEAVAQRLEEVRIATLNRCIDVDIRLGRNEDAVAELRQLITVYPFHEGLHARLMIALWRSGRTSDALTVYRGLRQSLIEELGVEPNQQLQTVHRAVLSADHLTLDQYAL